MAWINEGECTGGFLCFDISNRLALQLAHEPAMIEAMRTSGATGGHIAHHLMSKSGHMFAHKHAKGMLHSMHGGMVVGGTHRDILKRSLAVARAAYPFMSQGAAGVGGALMHGYMGSGVKRPCP